MTGAVFLGLPLATAVGAIGDRFYRSSLPTFSRRLARLHPQPSAHRARQSRSES
jgi:hypothetical protein